MPVFRWMIAAAALAACLNVVAAPPVSGPSLGRPPQVPQSSRSESPDLDEPTGEEPDEQQAPPELRALESSAAWSEIMTAIARAALPDRHEDRSDWGKTKSIFAGMEVESRGDRILPRISKREVDVRHGVWRKHRIELIHPAQTFQIKIRNVRPAGPGVTDFAVVVVLHARVVANLEHWVRGVKGFNMELVCNVRVSLHAACSLACRSEYRPGSVVPDLVLDPHVKEIKLRLNDLHVEKLGELRGDLAEELGNGSRRFVEDLLQTREDDLIGRARREIEKHRGDLRVSAENLFGN